MVAFLTQTTVCGFSLYQTLAYFLIYSCLGWCLEVVYAAVTTGKLVNRGFLNGPVCPIYGFGMVIVLYALTPLVDNTLLLYLGGVILPSVLELVGGWALYKLYRTRWWDYSDYPFNIGGYICLKFSIAWGLACLFVVDILHPTIQWVIALVPRGLGWVLLGVFAACMAVDLAATVSTIAKLNRKLEHIDQLASRIREASNEFGENLADKVLDAAEKGADFKESVQDFKEGMEDWSEDVRGDLKEDLDGARQAIAQYKVESELQRAERQQRRQQRRQELEQLFNSMRGELDGRVLGEGRLMKAFPQMRSTNHRQAMERLRRRRGDRR